MSKLDLYLLGTPRIEIDGQAVHIVRRKATALLAYLTVTGSNHNRDALATLLWPENGQSSARAELRRNLYVLKRVLGNEWLETDREKAGVKPKLNDSAEGGLWLDVAEFQQQIQTCETHEHSVTETCPDCIPHLEAAVELYTDHFMAGFSLPDCPSYDEWQFFQTEGLRGQLASTLLRLSSFYTSASRQDFETAIRYARRWLTIDPLHEPAHQHLMTLFAQSGQRVKAIQQYQECAHILNEELGINPSQETSALYERIQSEDICARQPGIKSKFLGRTDDGAFLDSLFNNPDVEMKLIQSDRQGLVYRTHDPRLDCDIHIQFYTTAGLNGKHLLEKARTLAKQGHPNIVKVLEAGEADLTKYAELPGGPDRSQPIPFIVTESVDGATLRDVRPNSFEDTVNICQQICAGLEHIHAKGIVHSSLRPEQIIISNDTAAMLMDFIWSEPRIGETAQSMALDKITFLAPEQILGQEFDFSADLYALGGILYEMTVGERPFQAEDPVTLISQILHTPLIPPGSKNLIFLPDLKN